jgi:hypothetical protein
MKKIILSMSMVLFAFMTQAAERTHQKNHFLPETISSTNAIAPCTVTVKGSVDLGPVAAQSHPVLVPTHRCKQLPV